jgi:hypothetical protein
MRWIVGGIAGWLAAMAPLLGVNIAGYASVFDSNTAVVAGAIALFGSILLGGMVTGVIAGRPSSVRAGGATTTLPAGVVAALLYIISLITVVMMAIRIEAAPAVVADHPLRISGAIVCLGAILLGVSLVFGVLTGRFVHQGADQRADQRADQGKSQAQGRSAAQQNSTQPSQPDNAGFPGRSSHGANQGAHTPYPAMRGRVDSQHTRESTRDRRNGGAQGDQPDYDSQQHGYGSYDEHQPARYSPGTGSREGGSSRGRDDVGREGRR